MMRFTILLALVALLLNGCGFHLRGTQSVTLPADYQTLRFNAGGLKNTEIASLLQNAMIERAGIHFSDDKNLPQFKLITEKFEQRVLSVRPTTGAATDYILIYRLYYSMHDAKGKQLAAPRQVYLQRDFRYDSTNALAMSRETDRLKNEMRLSAVDRVVQQLGYMSETLKNESTAVPAK